MKRHDIKTLEGCKLTIENAVADNGPLSRHVIALALQSAHVHLGLTAANTLIEQCGLEAQGWHKLNVDDFEVSRRRK